MIVYSSDKPKALVSIENGKYIYRWDLIEKSFQSIDGTSFPQWLFKEVVINDPLTSNKIVESVITYEFPSNYEQKLINEYNSVILGVITGDEAEMKTKQYVDFLQRRNELKAQIENDYQEFIK
jgi:hypothetical protein